MRCIECGKICPIAKDDDQRMYRFISEDIVLIKSTTDDKQCIVTAIQVKENPGILTANVPPGSHPSPDCNLAKLIKRIVAKNGSWGDAVNCDYVPSGRVSVIIDASPHVQAKPLS